MKQQKKPRTTPTFKQKNFAKAYVKHNGNGAQAALEAYDTDYDSAQVIAHENLRKPIVIEEINKILSKVKKDYKDDEWIAEKMMYALESGIGKEAKNSDAIKILDMLLKLKNTYPASKHMNMNLNVEENLSKKDINELKEGLKSLQESTSLLLNEFKS